MTVSFFPSPKGKPSTETSSEYKEFLALILSQSISDAILEDLVSGFQGAKALVTSPLGEVHIVMENDKRAIFNVFNVTINGLQQELAREAKTSTFLAIKKFPISSTHEDKDMKFVSQRTVRLEYTTNSIRYVFYQDPDLSPLWAEYKFALRAKQQLQPKKNLPILTCKILWKEGELKRKLFQNKWDELEKRLKQQANQESAPQKSKSIIQRVKKSFS